MGANRMSTKKRYKLVTGYKNKYEYTFYILDNDNVFVAVDIRKNKKEILKKHLAAFCEEINRQGITE